MGWFLEHLRRPRTALACYLRENGPIAYSLDIFGPETRERTGAMLASGLSWYWRTRGNDRAVRDWTRITVWSLAALLADLDAEQDGVRVPVLMLAVDGQDAFHDLTDAAAARWLRRFSGAGAGPLHAVLSRPAPGGALLFVAQQPPESVRLLLQAWRIDRDKAERRAYLRLREHSLEDIAGSLSPR